MAHIVVAVDDDYSPDVELDDRGEVVFARDCLPNAPILVPRHMISRMLRQRRCS